MGSRSPLRWLPLRQWLMHAGSKTLPRSKPAGNSRPDSPNACTTAALRAKPSRPGANLGIVFTCMGKSDKRKAS